MVHQATEDAIPVHRSSVLPSVELRQNSPPVAARGWLLPALCAFTRIACAHTTNTYYADPLFLYSQVWPHVELTGVNFITHLQIGPLQWTA